MSDIKTVWDAEHLVGDFVYNHGSLETGDDLATAILLSLFTDRRAKPDDEIPDGSDDPRGWWGDENEDVPIGSRLWLLSREKQTQETLNRANTYVAESLQWLIDDCVILKLEKNIQWAGRGKLSIIIRVYKPDGSNSTYKHAWAWKEEN